MAHGRYTIADMSSRVLAAALGAAVGLAAATPTASATDFFATTDNSKTTENCLTEATACALGRALQTVPSGFAGGGNPAGKHSLTLLPGRYDSADLDAGSSFLFNFNIKAGTQVGAKAGAERPVLAFGEPGGGDPAIEMTGGGALRDVVVECASFACVEVAGLSSLSSGVGVVPAVVERVRITSAPAPGGTEAYGLSLREFSRAANVDVSHSATKGVAVAASYDQPEDVAPKLVAVTATSTTAALSVSGGRDGSPETLVFPVVGTVLRGTPDVVAQSDAFSGAVPPGFQANPLRVDFKSSAVRSGASRQIVTTATSGPVTFTDTDTIDTTDLQIGADRVPVAGSPLVDKGTADADLGVLDVVGQTRTSGPAPDIGAYELITATTPVGGNPTPGGGGTPTPPGGGGTPAPAPPATPPAPDTKAPTPTSLTPPKTLKRSKLSKGKGVTLTATLDEAVASAKVELIQITKKKGKKPKEKVLGSATLGAGGPALRFALKVKGSKLGTKGKLKLTLRFTFVDAAGNKTVVDKPVTVS